LHPKERQDFIFAADGIKRPLDDQVGGRAGVLSKGAWGTGDRGKSKWGDRNEDRESGEGVS
jgi:hypothetical protein